jgi:hypothetical protein
MKQSADYSAKYPDIVAAGDLPDLFGTEAATEHRRDKLDPLRIVLHAPRSNLLVGANADVIDPHHLHHLLEAVDVFVEAGEEVPDAD